MTLSMRGRLPCASICLVNILYGLFRVGTELFDPKYSPHLLFREVINFFGYATETCVHDVQGIACEKNALGTHITRGKVRNVYIWNA